MALVLQWVVGGHFSFARASFSSSSSSTGQSSSEVSSTGHAIDHENNHSQFQTIHLVRASLRALPFILVQVAEVFGVESPGELHLYIGYEHISCTISTFRIIHASRDCSIQFNSFIQTDFFSISTPPQTSHFTSSHHSSIHWYKKTV